MGDDPVLRRRSSPRTDGRHRFACRGFFVRNREGVHEPPRYRKGVRDSTMNVVHERIQAYGDSQRFAAGWAGDGCTAPSSQHCISVSADCVPWSDRGDTK